MKMNEAEKIEKIEARMADLETQVRNLETEIENLESINEEMHEEINNNMTVVRAVAELQEELRKYHPDVFFIHSVRAPMGV